MWEVSTYTRGVRVTGLIIPRTGWYLTLGLVFGMLAFMRTNAYRRRTGSSPWHIHPLVWGLVSVFVAFFVTLLSIVFVAIFGTVLSIFAWAPRSQPSREPSATASLVSGIGPLVWGLVSVFVAFFVTLLSIVFVAIFGTVLSIFAWAPRSQPSREPGEDRQH